MCNLSIIQPGWLHLATRSVALLFVTKPGPFAALFAVYVNITEAYWSHSTIRDITKTVMFEQHFMW